LKTIGNFNFIEKFIEYFKRRHFTPTALSIFFNPLFLIRRGLYRGIRRNSHYMQGMLLDFGCGVKPYRELFNVENYIGIDIKQPESKYISKKVDIIYDGKTLPFADSSFDSIFASEVIEHIFEIDYTLAELNRVLKKSSYMLLTLPFVMEEHEIPYDFARYTSFGIRYLLAKHGFEIVNMEKTTNYIETIIQMWNIFLLGHFSHKHAIIRNLMTLMFISPCNILGIIFGAILSKPGAFYHNNLVVARKT